MTKNPFSDNCWQNSVSQYSIDTVAPATKRIAGFFLFPKLSVQSSMPFVLIIFSFISVFLCLQLIIISPKINIQSSFFFIYQCLTVMLRSEEHTSELQSRPHLVCRLLLEKKKKQKNKRN